jgi:hypothetical protein
MYLASRLDLFNYEFLLNTQKTEYSVFIEQYKEWAPEPLRVVTKK